MLISFVVPAHDEADWLADCLHAIQEAAAGMAYEIIVAADACSDATPIIAHAAGARVVHVQHRQIAASRNSGARWASGEMLCFVDADTRINAAALAAGVQALDCADVAGVGARLRFGNTSSLLERAMVRIVSRGFNAVGVIPGCFLMCRRTTFDAIGGFDERYYAAEDVLFSRALRARGKLRFVSPAVVSSERKLRSHGPQAHLALLGAMLLRGPRAVLRSRLHLGLWYDGSRRKPARPESS